MSLLLNVQEWIIFDDAIRRASQRGVFGENLNIGSWSEYALEPYRKDLLRAIFAYGVSLRFYAGGDTLVVAPRKVASRFIDDYLDSKEVTEWHSAMLQYHTVSLGEADLSDGDVSVLENGKRTNLYLKLSSRTEDQYQAACFIATWADLLHSDWRGRLEVKRADLDAMLDKALGAEGPISVTTKPHISQPNTIDSLPARTAGTFFAEYKAMAQTIATLVSKKPKDLGELANIVMDECEKSGNAMPVEQRTVKTRLGKA